METREKDLIAMLLGDAPPTPELRRWLDTVEGRRQLAAYRRTLETVDAAYRETKRPPVYWCPLATPIGRVLVAASAAGLVRLSFRQSEASFVRELRRRLRTEVVRSTEKTGAIVQQLRAYFAGERRHFDVQLDLRLMTPFQRRVMLAAAAVPPGEVVSYAEIARRIGQPRASRAVGQALHRNAIPIVLPCHRIVGSHGIGGYGGGLPMKRKLLRLEGALAAGG